MQQTIVIQNEAPSVNVTQVSSVGYDTIQRSSNNAAAAICSFLLPGLGQFIQGRAGPGIAFLLGSIVGSIAFVFPGVIVWVWSVIDAAVYTPPPVRRRRF